MPAELILDTRWQVHETRWTALKGDGWTYIRHESDSSEELFHVADDAKEQHNLAHDPAVRPILEQMREALRRYRDGPLVARSR